MKLNSGKTFAYIYFPFLGICLIATAIYSALNYFIFQHTAIMRESVSNLVLPAIFLSAAYVFFYKDKMNLIPKLRSDMMRSFFFVLILSVPGPIFFQYVVEDLSIRQYENINYEDITDGQEVLQYHLDAPLLYDTTTIGAFPRYYRSYNKNAPDDSHYELFIVTLVSSRKNQKPLFWFGRKYERVVSKDRAPDKEREEVFRKVIEHGFNDFMKSSNSEAVDSLELNRRDDEYQYFQSAVSDIDDNKNAELPILTAVQSRKSVGFTMRAVVVAFVAGQLIWALVCALIRVDPDALQRHQALAASEKRNQRWRSLRETFSYFIPRKGYMVTPIILNLNILVFLLLGFIGVSMLSPSGADLIPYGSSYTPLVYEGQLWRLFTAGFLHFGFIHILMNMTALGFCGVILEGVLGTGRFAIVYFVSLLGGSITSVLWNHPGNSAGASGAIFGIMGAMLFYAVFGIGDKRNRVVFFVMFGVFGLFTLITDLLGLSHSDVAGHVGGMFTGMIVAIFFIPTVRKSQEISI